MIERGSDSVRSKEEILSESLENSLKALGLVVVATTFIPEGRSHYGFEIELADKFFAIAKFERQSGRRDSSFNGPLSLERQRNLMELLRKNSLPAPKVLGIFETEQGPFILTEKLPGMHWDKYQSISGYTKEAYLKSLNHLGFSIADVQKIRFGSYGDVLSETEVSPQGIVDFADRVDMFMKLKMARARAVGVFDSEESEQVTQYLNSEINSFRYAISEDLNGPVLVLTDMHPRNFFVDEDGKTSGYFDLEHCQAAHSALEFYGLRIFLFNYYNGISNQALDTFMKSYQENGGVYDPDKPGNQNLERLLSVGHLISASTSYFGAKDGLRDTWSAKFKNILFEALDKGVINYEAVGNVFRMKTGQPRLPN